MIVHVNEMMIPGLWGWGHYATAFEDSLPTLFEALQDSGVPYRVAFVYDPTGVVHGRVPYIDETSSPASAAAIAMDQLKSATGSTDNDSSLDTLIAALTKNSDWLFEDEAWAGSKLALVSLNADDEWSTIDAPTAVSMARDLKEDDANVVFHSIAGLGSGCAVPHGPYKDAVDLTGGVAADVCDTEWHGHMEKIVAGSVVGGLKNGAIYIPLSGTPLVSSIRVQVDRADLPANWWYDASSNAVIFDPRFRIPGKELAVTYRGASTCGAR